MKCVQSVDRYKAYCEVLRPIHAENQLLACREIVHFYAVHHQTNKENSLDLQDLISEFCPSACVHRWIWSNDVNIIIQLVRVRMS
jgi:hypothetical protein